MFFAKYGLNANLVNRGGGGGLQRITSHLAITVSRALHPQDGRIPCPVDRNLEFLSTFHGDFLFIF